MDALKLAIISTLTDMIVRCPDLGLEQLEKRNELSVDLRKDVINKIKMVGDLNVPSNWDKAINILESDPVREVSTFGSILKWSAHNQESLQL